MLFFENCRFTENRSGHSVPFDVRTDGNDLNISFTNCLFDNNEVFDNPDFSVGWGGHAGQLLVEDGGILEANFTNCTWADNINNGSGTMHTMLPIYRRYAAGGGEAIFTNCVFNGNDNSTDNFEVGWEDAENSADGVDVIIDHCMFENTSGLRYTSETALTEIDVLFEDAGSMDYTLGEDSPAIDAGNTAAVSGWIPTIDLAMQERIQGDDIDLGCYESEAIADPGVGLDQSESIEMVIYPNPTTDIINIQVETNTIFVE